MTADLQCIVDKFEEEDVLYPNILLYVFLMYFFFSSLTEILCNCFQSICYNGIQYTTSHDSTFYESGIQTQKSKILLNSLNAKGAIT